MLRAPLASSVPVTSDTRMMMYLRERRPPLFTRPSRPPAATRRAAASAPSPGTSRRRGEQPVDRLLETARDLVAAGAIAVLALAYRVLDVAGLTGQLTQRDDH